MNIGFCLLLFALSLFVIVMIVGFILALYDDVQKSKRKKKKNESKSDCSSQTGD